MRLIWIVFWVVVASLLGATAVIGNMVFNSPAPANSTPFFEAVKASLLCLGGVGVILSTYFTAVNAFVQRKSDVIENTFDLLTRWDDPHLFGARKLTRRTKEAQGDTSTNQLLKEIEENEGLKNSVVLVLNYFEHVRFSLKNKRIDKELFKKSLGPTVVDIATRFEPYAEKLGQETVDDLNEVIEQLR